MDIYKDIEHIAELLLRDASQHLTEEESRLVDAWKAAHSDQAGKYLTWLNKDHVKGTLLRLELADNVIRQRLIAADLPIASKLSESAPLHRVHFLKKTWFRYAAAVLLIAGAITAVVVSSHRQPKSSGTDALAVSSSDILPGRDRAILTLANGQQIILDSTHGNIVKKGSLTVVNLAGKLKYEGTAANAEYNTLSTPRGGQYQIILPDGSKVWLNAASSIRFPTAFTNNERAVEITGEAYMEIAPDADQPFLVKADGAVIQVLGTSFNVNAYDDETEVRTTLVGGSVRVSTGGTSSGAQAGSVILKPGQQADLLRGPGNKIQVQSAPDMAQTLAWKNGFFSFSDVSIQAVMRQLARWYDLEVVYEGNVDKLFHATIPRNVPVSRVLKALELTRSVRFKVDGRKVIVMP